MTANLEAEFGFPSGRNLTYWIKEKKTVEVKLLTNDVLQGKLQWQDPHCLCLVGPNEQSIVFWRHAIAYIKPL
jgi:host factor-I protein